MSINFGRCRICNEYSLFIDKHTCNPEFEVTSIENFGYGDEDRDWRKVYAKDAGSAAEKFTKATWLGDGYDGFIEFNVVAVREAGSTDDPEFFCVKGYLDPVYESGDPMLLDQAVAQYKQHFTYKPF